MLQNIAFFIERGIFIRSFRRKGSHRKVTLHLQIAKGGHFEMSLCKITHFEIDNIHVENRLHFSQIEECIYFKTFEIMKP